MSTLIVPAAARRLSPYPTPRETMSQTFSMAWRARVFEPMASIAAAVGPMNFTPASTQAVANFAFSERKPYPG